MSAFSKFMKLFSMAGGVRSKRDPVTGGIEVSAGGETLLKQSIQALYIEAMVTHGRSGYGVPSGINSYPTKLGDAGTYEVTGVKVSGGKGETTLTIDSGTVADIAGTWSGVILHDDGIYRTYTVRSASGANLIVSPPLEAAVSRGLLTNVQDAPNGQHLTEAGSFALADTIYFSNPSYCVRDKYVGKIAETDTSGWSLYNGQSAVRVAYNVSKNVHTDVAGMAHMTNRKTKVIVLQSNVNAGLSKTWVVKGKKGYLETFVSCKDFTYPAIVDVYTDGYLRFREYVNSIRRILVPFSGADSLEVRITGAGAQTGDTHIGSTTLWEHPDIVQPTMFKDGERVGWAGDSWTSRCASAVIRRLNALGAPRGQTFIPIGKPGEQAIWLIDNWAKVIASDVDALIIEFFVNDLYSLTEAGVSTWTGRIKTIVGMCQADGIRPVVLMPASTGSQSQTQSLANWAAAIAEGTLSA